MLTYFISFIIMIFYFYDVVPYLLWFCSVMEQSINIQYNTIGKFWETVSSQWQYLRLSLWKKWYQLPSQVAFFIISWCSFSFSFLRCKLHFYLFSSSAFFFEDPCIGCYLRIFIFCYMLLSIYLPYVFGF